MARQQAVSISFTYVELVDLIVALRTRAEFLAYRSPEFALAYSRLAERVTDAGGDML